MLHPKDIGLFFPVYMDFTGSTVVGLVHPKVSSHFVKRLVVCVRRSSVPF